MIVVEPSTISGYVDAPPSKSETHRALVLGLLSSRVQVLRPLHSEDTRATLEGIRLLGASIEGEDPLVIQGGSVAVPDDVLHARNSGTTLRLLTAVAADACGTTVLTGDSSLRRRPMGPLLSALRSLGAEAFSTRGNGCAPIVVQGPLKGGRAEVPGNISSQFLSALLFSSVLAPSPVEISVTSEILSRPYVEMTLSLLQRAGAGVRVEGQTFTVEGGKPLGPLTVRVFGDWSSAALLWVAGIVSQGEVVVGNLDPSSLQGDRRVLDHFRSFGCRVERVGEGIRVEGGDLQGCTIDLSETPDLFPPLSVLGAKAHGTTTLSGAPHLRFKESDRISVLARELRKLGRRVEELEDGLRIEGKPSPLEPREPLDPEGDHRIFMALVAASLGASRRTLLRDPGSHSVSYPRFLEEIRRMGGIVEVQK